MTDTPKSHYAAIIPHPTEAKVLLVKEGETLSLPSVAISGGYFAYIHALVQGIHEQFGLSITVWRCVSQAPYEINGQATTQAIFICECTDKEIPLPDTCRWISQEEIESPSLSDSAQQSALQDWFAEQASPEAVSPLRAPWARHGWWPQVTQWIKETLAAQGTQLAGAIEPLKIWSISYVLRVPTTQATVYFKAVPELFATESGLTAMLALEFPGETPAILAVDTKQNYLLLPELKGSSLRDAMNAAPDTPMFPEAARRFARLQITCIDRTESLIAHGCSPRPLHDLPNAIAALLAEAEDPAVRQLYGLADFDDAFLRGIEPHVRTLVTELESLGIPETLLHGDLHSGNIYVDGTVETGSCVFFDWSDGAITHPFFDLITFIGTPPEEKSAPYYRYLDTYLEPWAELYPLKTLHKAVAVAQQLAPAYHAVSYGNIARATEPANRWELASAVGAYLKGFKIP